MQGFVLCSYCARPAVLVDSAEVHSRSYGKVWLCRPCNAWVGVHPGTTKPLGRLANATLRRLKIKAHDAFDPHWKADPTQRQFAYSALAYVLGIPLDGCHIGEFDEAMCQRVIDACNAGLVRDAMKGKIPCQKTK